MPAPPEHHLMPAPPENNEVISLSDSEGTDGELEQVIELSRQTYEEAVSRRKEQEAKDEAYAIKAVKESLKRGRDEY
jgi:hypothetical protein